MNNNIFKYKKLVLASLVAVITACGGDYDGGTESSDNTPPMLDSMVKPEPVVMSPNPEPGTGCEYVDTEDANIQQLNCTFHTTDALFNIGGDAREFFDVDLRTGVLDPDIGDSLSISNLRFLWEGVNCFQIRFNTVRLEDNPQCGSGETIDDLVAALPVEEQTQYDGMSIEDKLERFRVRQSQSLPLFVDRDYAFEQQRFSYRVTPSNMKYLLRQGQYTAVHLQYEVTDGDSSITRRLYIRVNGVNQAPRNLNPIEGDENYRVGWVFDTDPNTSVDLLAGFVDDDIQAAEADEEANGSIAERFRLSDNHVPGDYNPQELQVGNFEYIDGLGEGVGYVFNAGTGELEITSGAVADSLTPGAEAILQFEYEVFDGDPILDDALSGFREFEFAVVGTDPSANDAPFFREDLFIEVGNEETQLPWGGKYNFNLFALARDPEGDPILLESLDFGGASELFGVDTSSTATTGIITVDTVAFYNIPEGESRDIVLTYELTDGTAVSEERTYTIRMHGYERNLLKNAGVDYGFESGVLSIGAPSVPGGWSYGWSADGAASDMVDVGGTMRPVQNILDASSGLMPYAGDYFLYTSPGWSTSVLRTEALPVGMLEANRRYYVNFWAKASNIWSSINVGIGSDNDWDNRQITVTSPVNGTSEWKEHTGYFLGDPAYDEVTPISFWFQSGAGNEVLYDNVSIVPYFYDPERDFAGPQTFEGDSFAPWEVLNVGGGSATITSAAGFNEGTGLEVDTTGATDTVIVRLSADSFPDGAIQDGARFRVEIDMRFFTHPEDGDGASNATVTAAFYDQANPTTRLALNNFLVNASWKKLDYTFNVDVLNTGAFDWGNLDVGFQLEFDKPDQTFYVDNIRVYQVP